MPKEYRTIQEVAWKTLLMMNWEKLSLLLVK